MSVFVFVEIYGILQKNMVIYNTNILGGLYMFKSKREKENEKYIKETFNFEYDKEILIYNYLCKRRLSKKELKKYKKYFKTKEQLIKTYKDWEKSITDKYRCYNSDSLNEFIRFLRYITSSSDVFNKVFYSFMIPLEVAFVSAYLANTMVVFDKSNLLIMLIEALLLVLLFIVFFTWVTFKTFNMSNRSKFKEDFYNDYIEVINKIIKDKASS